MLRNQYVFLMQLLGRVLIALSVGIKNRTIALLKTMEKSTISMY